MTIEPYRPSNGTGASVFMEGFCFKCVKFPQNYDDNKQCQIFLRTMAHDIDEPEYPNQWQYLDGKPTCTAFKDRDQFNAERRANRKALLSKVRDGDMFGETP